MDRRTVKSYSREPIEVDLIGLVQDYKANIPLNMLESKYGIPIHTIISTLHKLTIEDKKNESSKNDAQIEKVEYQVQRHIRPNLCHHCRNNRTKSFCNLSD